MLNTEKRNPETTHIDTMDTARMVQIMQQENKNAVDAIDSELDAIAAAIDAISARMKQGGRLFYIGCGTSGRLGVLDASECPPTYGVSKNLVVGIIAGGDVALRNAVEGAEDSKEAGRKDVAAHEITELDSLVGISAAGGAAYVLGAMEYAREKGALTVSLTNNANRPIEALADIVIHPDTGAEVVTGSTRMKAGTAQKLVLNMISTCAMIHQGHVYENLMVNLKPTNIKLRGRTIRITSSITGLPEEQAEALLEENNWVIRQAVQTYLDKKTVGRL